ncbi:hypothetical protein FF1_018898 [Malus domestica]
MPQQSSHSSYNQTVQEQGNYSQVVQNNQKKVSQIIPQKYHRRLHQHHPEHARRIGQVRGAGLQTQDQDAPPPSRELDSIISKRLSPASKIGDGDYLGKLSL